MTTPLLSDLIAAAVAAGARGLRVSIPARVESYDRTTGKISAQPLIMDGEVGEDGVRRPKPAPVVPNATIMWPRTSRFGTTCDLEIGDTVLLVFSDRALDRWLVRGGIVDPADDRAHHGSDAVAIPGLFAFADAPDIPDVPMRVGAIEGAAAIEFDDSEIRAGGSGALATKGDLDNFLTALDAAIPGAGTAAPALTALKAALTGPGGAWLTRGTTVLKGG